MELKDLKKIIELMKSNELTEFEFQDQDTRIALKRKNGGDVPVIVQAAAPAPVLAPPAGIAPPAAIAAPAVVDVDDGLADIPSPMVGTFYRSPTPESDSFVAVGDTVDVDTTVCIVEAMKVMNEIKAEKRGVIKKILIDNASPVEFGQALFKIETV